jgi:hypothetical protein
MLQLWQLRQSHRPIRVEISSASFETSRDGHKKRNQVIVFELLNRGPYALQIADLGLQKSDGNVIYVGSSSEWMTTKVGHAYTIPGFSTEPVMTDPRRSSRPHRIARRTGPHLEARIERERRRHRWGPLRLSWLLQLARSTIDAVLRRLGLSRRRDLAPRPPRAHVRRYERPTPGDLLHVDTKKIGRLGPGGGKRFGPQRASAPYQLSVSWAAVDTQRRHATSPLGVCHAIAAQCVSASGVLSSPATYHRPARWTKVTR